VPRTTSVGHFVRMTAYALLSVTGLHLKLLAESAKNFNQDQNSIATFHHSN